MTISLIVAVAENNVIGKNNQLAWHLPADLKLFKNLTTGHHIIMGRKTYESIGKPLPDRISVIITRQENYKAEGCIVVKSLQDAIQISKNDEEVFIIGGAEIFREAIPIADKIYLTRIHQSFEGDTFFQELDQNVWEETKRIDFNPDEKNKYPYSFCILEKKQYF